MFGIYEHLNKNYKDIWNRNIYGYRVVNKKRVRPEDAARQILYFKEIITYPVARIP